MSLESARISNSAEPRAKSPHFGALVARPIKDMDFELDLSDRETSMAILAAFDGGQRCGNGNRVPAVQPDDCSQQNDESLDGQLLRVFLSTVPAVWVCVDDLYPQNVG